MSSPSELPKLDDDAIRYLAWLDSMLDTDDEEILLDAEAADAALAALGEIEMGWQYDEDGLLLPDAEDGQPR